MGRIETGGLFQDRRQQSEASNDLWPVVIVGKTEIDGALERLTRGAAAGDGRREASLVHPRAGAPAHGLAPGIEVLFGVLLPGESTAVRRHNASDITLTLSGRAKVVAGPVTLDVGERDVHVVPSMEYHRVTNIGTDPYAYVTYSNRALLRLLEVYYTDHDEQVLPAAKAASPQEASNGLRAKDVRPPISLRADHSGQLLSYEHLVDPEWVESHALVWPWTEVQSQLEAVTALGPEYNGRPLYSLYNPASGDRNGTNDTFFASWAAYPANKVDIPHRHTSAAINYILDGGGWSIIDGQRVEWGSGDIMLSAPGWAPHGHASGPEGALILTVQDHPLHIGMDSLVWQEKLKGPIRSLGSGGGFQTNVTQMLAEALPIN